MKRLILSLLASLTLICTPTLAFAASGTCGTADSDATNQVLTGINETSHSCDTSGIQNVVAAIVNILSYVVGIVSVIALISGAFKYVTSGGESGKVANAKHTILYALIGLIIVALAQFIVIFVLNTATNAVNSCKAGQHVVNGKCQ